MHKILPVLVLLFFSFQSSGQGIPFDEIIRQKQKRGYQQRIQSRYTSFNPAGKAVEDAGSTFGNAPSYSPMVLSGGNGPSSGQFLLQDASGGKYVIGQYYKEINFKNHHLEGQGIKTYFIARFSDKGEIVSAANLFSAEATIYVTVEVVEKFGDGFLVSGVTAGGVILVGNEEYSIGGSKGFLGKFAFNGNNEWFKTYKVARNYFGISSEIAVKNDSIFAGFTSDAIQLLNSFGEEIHRYPIKGSGERQLSSLAIHGDSLLVGGWFEEEINVGGLSVSETNFWQSSFIGSINIKNGNANWLNENSVEEDEGYGDSYIADIQVVNDLSILVCGSMRSFIDWGNGKVPGYDEGGFLSKFDPQGHAVKTVAFNSDEINTIFTSGAIYLNGQINEYNFIHSTTGKLHKLNFNLDYIQEINLPGTIYTSLLQNGKLYFSGEDQFNFSLYILDHNLTQLSNLHTNDVNGVIEILSMESDLNQNTFIYANKSGTVDFFGEILSDSSTMVLAKKTRGNHLLWTKKIYSSGLDPTSLGNKSHFNPLTNEIAIIGEAHAGFAIGNTQFDFENNFAAKLSSEGTLIWAKEIPFESCNAVASDEDGSVYVSGTFSDSVTIGGNTYYSSTTGVSSAFILKLDNAGNFQWCKQFGGEFPMSFNALVSTNGNAIVFTSEIYDAEFVVNGTLYKTNNTEGNNILIQMNKGGDIEWLKVFGGDKVNDEKETSYGCWVSAIEIDANGNIFMTGFSRTNNDIGDVTLTSPYLYNHFIAKFNATGKVMWAKVLKIPGKGFNYNEIALDKASNLYIQGNYMDTIYFDDEFKFINPETDYGARGLYVAKVSSAGEFRWAQSFHSTGYLAASGMALHENNSFEIAGTAYAFLNTDVSYPAYYGKSYMINFCEGITSAPIASGPAEVWSYDTTGYEAETGETIHWHLSPEEAGKIIGSGNHINIAWNEDFNGEASIQTSLEFSCGESIKGDALVVHVKSIVAGIEDKPVPTLQTFPNPVNDKINIRFQEKIIQPVNISLTDITGKEVRILDSNRFIGNNMETSYSVRRLKAGMYILLVETKERTFSELIIKK